MTKIDKLLEEFRGAALQYERGGVSFEREEKAANAIVAYVEQLQEENRQQKIEIIDLLNGEGV